MYSTTVIDESTWGAFGNPNTPESPSSCGRLLTENGLQCCLGFECEQCGISRKNLLGKPVPRSLAKRLFSVVSHLAEQNRTRETFARRAMDINDSMTLDYDTKKNELRELWHKQGWKLMFVKTGAALRRKIKELKAKGE